MADYLFTWKRDQWPHEKLRALVDHYEKGEAVTEPWRVAASKAIRPGDRGYLFKQGDKPRGIFGVAIVEGFPYLAKDFRSDKLLKYVNLRMETLVDPDEQFLVGETEIRNLPAPSTVWTMQSSGNSLPSAAAREIDKLVALRSKPPQPFLNTAESENVPASRIERLQEVYYRDQALVRQLKQIYQGHCQICNSKPFNGKFGDVSEGHHINWLCDGGSDTLDNLVLLCPNHHAAIHASSPTFDWERLEYKFAGSLVPIRLNNHLKPKQHEAQP